MKSMRHEGGEQIASSTPILDSILSKLPPPKLELRQFITLNEAEQAQARLLQKFKDGDLTQTDIEQELRDLPDVGGMEDSKIYIIDAIRIHIAHHGVYDIRKLPVDTDKKESEQQ